MPRTKKKSVAQLTLVPVVVCSNCKKNAPDYPNKMCRPCLDKAAEKMRRRKAAGRCYECGAPPEAGHTRCRACLDQRNEERRRKNEERARSGLCISCADPPLPATAGAYCEEHFFRANAANANHRCKHGPRARGDELKRLWDEQRWRCAYTGLPLTLATGKCHPTTATLDHKTSLYAGGDNTSSNLQWIASGVNEIKGRFTDEEFRFLLGETGLKRLALLLRKRAAAEVARVA